MSFGADSAPIVPAGIVHRITNSGNGETVLIGGLSTSPVVVETPERVSMPLLWTA